MLVPALVLGCVALFLPISKAEAYSYATHPTYRYTYDYSSYGHDYRYAPPSSVHRSPSRHVTQPSRRVQYEQSARYYRDLSNYYADVAKYYEDLAREERRREADRRVPRPTTSSHAYYDPWYGYYGY